MDFSYDTSKNTITVDGNVYNVERTPDRGHPEETLTIKDFDVNTDDWVFPFPGLEGSLGYEEHTEGMSPRDWSNVGTMAVSYRGYDLGDEDISDFDFEVNCPKCGGSGCYPSGTEEDVEVDCEPCEGEGVITLDPIDYFKKQHGARVVIPLTVYEHSGITMRAGNVTLPFDTDRWDTSFVGFIYDTPKAVKECMGDNVADEDIEKCLRQEVEVYASYLEGDVTWYTVQDEETGFHESCGGYVADHKHCENECFDALGHAIVKRLAEQAEREHWNARGTETR